MKERIVRYNNKTKKEEIIEVELSEEEIDKREKEMELIRKSELVEEAKRYLENTDYVIIKLYESFVQGDSILEMIKEYKEVFAKRKEARKTINDKK